MTLFLNLSAKGEKRVSRDLKTRVGENKGFNVRKYSAENLETVGSTGEDDGIYWLQPGRL